MDSGWPAHVTIGRCAIVQHAAPDVDHVFDQLETVLHQRRRVQSAVTGHLLDLQLFQQDVQHEHVTRQTLFGHAQRQLIHGLHAPVGYRRHGAAFLHI